MNFQLLTILVIAALFSQARGYCGARLLRTSITRAAIRAAEWLKNQQNKNGSYGLGHVSAFAFNSLRLTGHSVSTGAKHLNAELTKADIGSLTGGRVALYILGALATCKDPSRFYDVNLVRSLRDKLNKFPQLGFNHSFQYSLAVMALCSSNTTLNRQMLGYVDEIRKKVVIESSVASYHVSETLAMQIMALTCVKNSIKGLNKKILEKKIHRAVHLGGRKFLKAQINDSTFGGNEVTAALASQALLAAKGKTKKCSETLRWLVSRQKPDGSFINLLSTLYVTPALIGALPYDVKDIVCLKTTDEREQQNITVCVELRFVDTNKDTEGKTPPPTKCVTVANGTNAHNILKEAAKKHPCYAFTTQTSTYGHSVTSICGVQRRPVDKFYWMIYIDEETAPVGVDELKPAHGSTLSFRYKQLHWR
ncbi:gastric intrinsic factor-like [Stylophora pistillata]|uniref:Gastric intrinsic factor n=1 Tax=Stylophora pistillata TaxID=50429 RepID=A0A2B4S493_STYPI|nr:gastric intrinsic factor-like [Stylophora pistillata]PFX24721.1 Gastric intrinsic factor [Stylophora pistillata]